MKKLFRILCSACFLVVLALGVISCGDKEAKFLIMDENREYTVELPSSFSVEYGETFAIPAAVYDGEKTTVTVKTADGKSVAVSYNSFTAEIVGEYQITYTSASGKTKTVVLVCADTIKPKLTIFSTTPLAYVGDEVAFFSYMAEDKAGIDETKTVREVIDPDGEKVEIVNDEFLVEKPGVYVQKLSVTDKNGLTITHEETTVCFPKYVDETLSNTELFSFDTEDYVWLVGDVEGRNTASREIIHDGYPVLKDEVDENGVLKISSSYGFGNVYTGFVSHQPVLASAGHRIVIRFAVSEATDFVKLYCGDYVAGRLHRLEANTWYELEVNPLDFGYGRKVTDFVICYRNKGNTDLFIDSIYLTEYPFIDENLSDSNLSLRSDCLADFDEEGYLDIIYQNMYNAATTSRQFRVDGTEFEITDDYPQANGENAIYPNIGASGKVLKFNATTMYSGLTYMFPEPIDLTNVESMTFRMYIDQAYSAIVFGFFDQYGTDEGNTIWISNTTKIAVGAWSDFTLTADQLHRFTVNNTLTGVFLQFHPHTASPSVPFYVTGYIDRIDVKYEYNEDIDVEPPTLTSVTSGDLSLLVGDGISAENFISDMHDTLDDNPVLEIVSIKKGGVEFIDEMEYGVFVPTESGVYIFTFRAKDAAGNISTTDVSCEVFIRLYEEDGYPYYDFVGAESLHLVGEYSDDYYTSYGTVTSDIVQDENARDGWALSATINTAGTGYAAGVSIDLGYDVPLSKLKSLTVSFRFADTTNTNWWPRFKLGRSSTTEEGNTLKSVQTLVSDTYTTLTWTSADIAKLIEDGKYFGENITSLNLVILNYGAKFTVYIDYVEVIIAENIDLTFSYQGGTDGTGATQKTINVLNSGMIADVAPVLTKSGTYLCGWTLDPTTNELITEIPLKSKTLYAVWFDNELLQFNDEDSLSLASKAGNMSSFTFSIENGALKATSTSSWHWFAIDLGAGFDITKYGAINVTLKCSEKVYFRIGPYKDGSNVDTYYAAGSVTATTYTTINLLDSITMGTASSVRYLLFETGGANSVYIDKIELIDIETMELLKWQLYAFDGEDSLSLASKAGNNSSFTFSIEDGALKATSTSSWHWFAIDLGADFDITKYSAINVTLKCSEKVYFRIGPYKDGSNVDTCYAKGSVTATTYTTINLLDLIAEMGTASSVRYILLQTGGANSVYIDNIEFVLND